LKIERATGLILRTRPLTETSLIVNWLTAEFGRLSTVAKGARRPKSPFRGKLDLFYLADFTFHRSRRSELHTLREVGLRDTRAALRRDLGRLQQASYAAALIEQTTERETPLPAIYELMRSFLDALPLSATQPQSIFAFELKLLEELGLKPDLANSKLTPGAKQILAALVDGDWTVVTRLKLSQAQVNELRQFLHGFMIFHLGKIPAGRNAVVTSQTRPA
jgi:DNA repair protein RecO (recombination protein O)